MLVGQVEQFGGFSLYVEITHAEQLLALNKQLLQIVVVQAKS
jgi:hypothetical protein